MSAVTIARDFARLTDDELLLEYHEGRDPDARDELVKRFIPFARKLALRYVHSREPLDDLVQVASLGLLNALARFEPEASARSSRATPRPRSSASSSAISVTKAGPCTCRATCRSGH